MKISCCLIIRDEMPNLPRLWESLRPHVDEICALDTGSTDGSAEWCRERADKWSHTSACNDASGRIVDFALARNLNLAMASHEALLWLDGDDELVGGAELRKLASEAHRQSGGAFSVLARYDYDPQTVQWRERLVYPRTGFEWRGPVHEGLLGKAGTAPVQIQTDLFHVRHRRHELGKAGEPGRNLRILRQWFEANGEADIRLMHYFGAELLGQREIGEALYWLRRHAAISPWSDERCLSLMHLARVAFAFGDYTEAARWAMEALATKSWPEPCWMMGMSWCALSERGIDREHNLRRGLHWLERGMRLDSDPTQRSLLMVDPTAKYEACEWLAPVLAKVGRLEDAIRVADEGLRGKPGSEVLRANLLEWKRVKVMEGVSELERLGGAKKHAQQAVAAVLAGNFAERTKDLPGSSDGTQGNPATKGRVVRPETRVGSGKLRIAFWIGHQLEPWTPETLERDGMGGSETMAWELSKRLAKLGHDVYVFAHLPPDDVPLRAYGGVEWQDADHFTAHGTTWDVLIVSRQCEAIMQPHTAKARVLWVHDVHCGPGFTPMVAVHYDLVWCLSKWHREFFLQTYPWLAPGKVEVTRNGIDVARFSGVEPRARNPHRAIYSSSPDRGLAEAVAAWPAVRAAIPDAELHCYYGFDNWERSIELGGENGLPQCSRAAIEALKKAVAETEGVFMHGRVNQKQLAEAMLGAGVWFYPTWFSETSCITAMEAQAAGLRCVCPPIAALAETVVVHRWTGNPVTDVVNAMHDAGESGLVLTGNDLDTLALDWEKRLTALVREAEERVVPRFEEAAQ